MSPLSSSARRRAIRVDCLARFAFPFTCQNLNTKHGAQILTSRPLSLQMEVSLQLVDMTSGLHVVLSNRDGAVALLVDINNEG